MIKDRYRDSPTIRWCRPQIEAADRAAVDALLRRRFLVNGAEVLNFQERFENFIGGGRAVATTSCMAALHMAAILIGLKPGDEVLVPALTHAAAVHAVELSGAKPVFADAHIESGNVDNQALERLVTGRTRAIFSVHHTGIPAYMRSTMDIARRHDLRVVEDCATALGTSHSDRHVGLIGDIGCFSFHVKKHITTGGEGGMLVTKHQEIADRALKLRSFGYGQDAYGDAESLGLNYRMTELQALLGAAQLARMPDLMAARIANLKALNAALPRSLARFGSSYGMTVFMPDGIDRDAVRTRLAQRAGASSTEKDDRAGDAIETAVHYPRAVPDLAVYRAKYGEQKFPVARYISATTITLPVGPHLWPEQMQLMANRLGEAIDEVRARGRGRVSRPSPGAEAEAGGPRASRPRSSQRQPSRAIA